MLTGFLIQEQDVEELFKAASTGDLNTISECINWKNIPVDISDEVRKLKTIFIQHVYCSCMYNNTAT